jgi:superfamily II DNA or RNA helicase/HKD family nuclease
MPNFITNADTKDLRKRIIELIERGEEMKFLVGFFYFSGIKELYEGLKKNPDAVLKILVGLQVDVLNAELFEMGKNEKRLTDQERIEHFLVSLKKSLNTADFDTQEFYEQVGFFLDLIHQNRLILRKTRDPNHAKLYLFHLDHTQIGKRKLFLTGSSNLTKAGVSTQNEFNVEISDYGYEEAEQYFDALWEDSVEITENDATKQQLMDLIKKETLVKDITPFEAFCLLLKTYLDSFEKKELGEMLLDLLQKNGYKIYQYQLDATAQALSVLEKNNGVIIADVVGLGKTIIACSIAKELGKRGIVICPPGLIGDKKNKTYGWEKYIEQFRLHDWEVRSLGDLEDTLLFVQKRTDIEVVIIDEAHRFRNQDTKNYELLKNICRGKKVILLTATPFNNHPGDIFSMLKLFTTPKKSSLTLSGNLEAQFQAFGGVFDRLSYIKKHHSHANEQKRNKAIAYYKALFGEPVIDMKKVKERTHFLARQIRSVLEQVTIRRNRLDLKAIYPQEVGSLSEVSSPKEWFYELTKEQSEFYDEILKEYFSDPDTGGRFTGAMYRPFEYEKGLKNEKNEEENRQYIQQQNLFDFMRRLLVKRFESSFGAFEKSIQNFQRITESVSDFINRTGELILDRSLIEKMQEMEEEELQECLEEYEKSLKNGNYPKNHRRYKVKTFERKDEFLRKITQDLTMFGEILDRLRSLHLVENDPKAECLIQHLQKEFQIIPKKNEPKQKVLIFSEYADTVAHLKPHLEKAFPNRVLVVSDINPTIMKILAENFDASHETQKDEYDIILSTDKISEGFNLNRAGMVINYDIPWNPVRVIQRLGRINRMSKKVFETLSIVNFFPTEKGAEFVQSRMIATNKMFLIHSILGEDAKIFDEEEDPTPSQLFDRIQQNPDEQESESFYTKLLRIYAEVQKTHPDLIASLALFPVRVKVAKKGHRNELFVFYKKGRIFTVRMPMDADAKTKPEIVALEDFFDDIACEYDEKGLDWNTEAFWTKYAKVQSYKWEDTRLTNDQSLDQQAINVLSTLLQAKDEALLPFFPFFRTLREDMLEYGTLSQQTCRRIIEWVNEKKPKEKFLEEISALSKELGGEQYLEAEKQQSQEQPKDIIIAIENKVL